MNRRHTLKQCPGSWLPREKELRTPGDGYAQNMMLETHIDDWGKGREWME